MKHPIPAEALKESVAIIGRRGSGKTYTAKGAVEILLREQARVCIIDPTGVWWGLRSSVDGKKAAFPVVVFGGDHADVPIADTSGAALAQILAGQNLPSIVDLSEFTRAGMARFMGAFLEELYRANRQPLTLIVDEADIFAPQRPEPETATMLGRMEQIVRRGRVRGFRPWLITQRPASLNKNVLSQANTLIAMQLTAPQDRDALGAWIEGQADREEGKKILGELPRLQKGEGYVWAPSHGILERVKFPPIKTFDSSRSPEDGEALPQVTVAEVDLAGIGEALRTVEKEAADNDPKLLRAEIAKLKKEAGKTVVQAMELERDELVAEYRRGYRDGAVAPSEIYGRLASAFENADKAMHDLRQYVGSQAVQKIPERPIVRKAIRHPGPHPDSVAIKRETAVSGSNGALTRAERLILTALAQYPQGRTKTQVAILTGYAGSGGGFRNALGSLRTKEYIGKDVAHLIITPGGVTALGSFDPLPTGPELLTYWYGQLTRAERKALEALASAYPRTLSPAQVANMAGYEAAGGGFRNALGKLRTLELISGRAELKASDDLF